eukprot:767286-Hanusia_phi.AAC.9
MSPSLQTRPDIVSERTGSPPMSRLISLLIVNLPSLYVYPMSTNLRNEGPPILMNLPFTGDLILCTPSSRSGEESGSDPWVDEETLGIDEEEQEQYNTAAMSHLAPNLDVVHEQKARRVCVIRNGFGLQEIFKTIREGPRASWERKGREEHCSREVHRSTGGMTC